MNAATLKWLAIATVGLLLLMVLVDQTDRSDTVSGGDFLFPQLKDHINDINEVLVTADSGTISIVRDGDRWKVKEKAGFPADVGKIREVLLAIADARKLEQKTADPERHAQLGVAGPESGSGTLLELIGVDMRHAVVIGNVAQSKNRYVRLAGDDQCWLIDKNPNLPAASSGWLASALLDIDTSRIRSVEIRHEDGETLRLAKASADDANFTVLDIPEGRELSYATVANGIAGVLDGLNLEDVRHIDTSARSDPESGDGRRVDSGARSDLESGDGRHIDTSARSDPESGDAGQVDAGAPGGVDSGDAQRSDTGELLTTSVFTTFDGLEIRLQRFRDDEGGMWLTIAASYTAPASGGEAAAAAEDPASGEIAIDDTSKESATAVSAEEEAGAINAQHAGWQYKIPEYKANLLARRWSDILKEKQ